MKMRRWVKQVIALAMSLVMLLSVTTYAQAGQTDSRMTPTNQNARGIKAAEAAGENASAETGGQKRVDTKSTKDKLRRASSDFVIENGVLKSYRGSDSDVVVPDGVTTIGGLAFFQCYKVTSVRLPNSVKAIDWGAFLYSGLRKIIIPDSVYEIEYGAFGGTALNEITLPNSVLKLGNQAFKDCTELQKVKLSEMLTTVDSWTFQNCNNLDSITIPKNVRTIGMWAFSGCSRLHTIELPNKLETIDSYAFERCDNLNSIKLPDSLKKIGQYAFSYCNNLMSVKIPRSVSSIDNTAFEGSYAVILQVWRNSYAHKYAIENDIKYKVIDGSDPSLPPTITYKPVEDVPIQLPTDTNDKIRLFEDASGDVGNKPIADVFPGNYSLKIPLCNAEIKKESLGDGRYKLKIALGFVKDSAKLFEDEWWENFKKDVEDAEETVNKVQTLDTLMKKYGASSGNFNITKKFKAKPKMGLIGYYEAIIDENGKTISHSGGILVEAKWKASTTNQWLVGPVPIYVELNGGLKLQGDGKIQREVSTKKLSIDGSIKMNPGIAAGVGVGVSGLATVGIEGDADLSIQLIPISKGDFTAGIHAKAQLIYVFDWNYTIAEQPYPLWDTTKKTKSLRGLNGAGLSRASKLSLASRDYQEKTSAWNGAMKNKHLRKSTGTGITTAELQRYILPNTIPKMKKLGNDTVMIFQSNDTDRATQNSVKLMYSVYNGSQWSMPTALWDNGTLDSFADLEQVGGELYVVWQKCKEKITTVDAEAGAKKAAEYSEICWSKYDANTKHFGQSSYLTDDSNLDMMPCIVKGREALAVAWIHSTKNDLTGMQGSKTIQVAELQDGSFGKTMTLGTTDDFISEMDAVYENGAYKAAVIHTDTQSNPKLSMVKEGLIHTIVPGQDETISGLKCQPGTISYVEAGAWKQYSLSDEQETEILSGESAAISANAVHVSCAGKNTILWMNNDQDGCHFYSSIEEDNGYSKPVEVYHDDKVHGKYFTAALNTDGDWEIVYSAADMNNKEKTSMYFATKKMAPKAELDSVVINENELDGASQPVSYSVTNNGEEPITEIHLTVKNAEQTLLEKDITCEILPGESSYFEDAVELDTTADKQNITVQTVAAGQQDMDNTAKISEVKLSDFGIDVKKQVEGKNVKFKATVTNNGFVTAGGTVSFYGDKDGNRKLQSKSFSPIEPGETTEITFSYNAKDMKYTDNKSAYCMLRLKTDTAEYNEMNNTYYGVTYLWELPEGTYDIAQYTVSGVKSAYTYTGHSICPAVTINGLNKSSDYAVDIRNNVNAGTAIITISGRGIYTGTITKTFRIDKAAQKLTGTKAYKKVYGSKAFRLNVKSNVGEKLSYTSSNKKIATVNSTGTVNITGTGTCTIRVAAATKNHKTASMNVTVKVTPMAAPKVKAAANGLNSIRLSWNKVPGAKGYYIYRSTKKSSGYKRIKTTKASGYTDGRLKSGKKYYYKVKAYASNQKIKAITSSAVSATATLKTPDISISVEKNLKSVRVTWKKSSGATGYQVYRATSKKGKYQKVATVKSMKYIDKKMSRKKTYYYKVRAYKKSKGKIIYSGYSSVKSVRTK